MPGVSSESKVDAKIWPLTQFSPDIELALDAQLPIPFSSSNVPLPRMAIAYFHEQTTTHVMRLLDILDQHLYEPYSPVSRYHLSAPRYEEEYQGLSIVDLLKANREAEVYNLISKDVASNTQVEVEKRQN